MRGEKSYPKVGSLPKDLLRSAFPSVLLPPVLLPHSDFARLTSLLVTTTLLLFVLVNDTLKQIYLNTITNKEVEEGK